MRWPLLLGLAACGGGGAKPADAPPPPDMPVDMPVDMMMIDANPLETLQGTGLCVDASCTQISPDAHEYVPQFPLWSDGATKRRWFQLPPGTQIDTSNMDHWVFPVGTKFWKEFTRDGTRVETRMILKQDADEDAAQAFFYVAYAWNAAQDATTALSMGATDVLGTMHDIPSRANCRECHEALRPGRILGFGAIQLDYAAPANLTDLDDLIAQNLLTVNPAGAQAPHFPLPGSAVEKAAYGYLHANCGSCHNPTSDAHDVTPVDFRLDTTKLASTSVIPAVVTTVNVQGRTIIDDPNCPLGTGCDTLVVPHDVDHSVVIVRTLTTNGSLHMPKTASEVVDPDGQTQLKAWINSL
jgi:hypothetical protein